MTRRGLTLAVLATAVLAGCASAPRELDASPRADATALAPSAWQTPLPHGGDPAALTNWWRQFDDPLVTELVEAAEDISPSVSAARARVADARAARTAARATLLPGVDASASAQRGVSDSSGQVSTSANASLTASWELDLFGGNAAASKAAEARAASAQTSWHEARVSIAAEVATTYTTLRACEAQVEQVRIDAESRAETARLTELTARAGFDSPANAALARASAAQRNAQLVQQITACEVDIKALVALTGWAEPRLRNALVAARGRVAEPKLLTVPALPADLLRQRPDLASAERNVVAASADIRQREADRLPRVRLNGSIGSTYFSGGASGGFGGPSGSGATWSIGPVSVTLPIFDAGTRAANVEAAKARHDDAVVQYRAALRQAVQEVEGALLTLQSTAARQTDAEVAADGYATSLRAAESRQRAGLGSLFELEEARRTAVLAQTTLIDLRREHVTAWITLYRALGGG
jgi:NodT family efflux transporter outer membrane factor (OMF) lipoprotein